LSSSKRVGDRLVEVLRACLPLRVRRLVSAHLRRYLLGYVEAAPSFAQCGEDRLLDYLFKSRTAGFYVDVGAFHPVAFSNTLALYLQGWRGINIDAFPGSMKAFHELRPRDINVECAIAEGGGERDYIQIGSDHHQMNSFAPEFQARFQGQFGIRPDNVRRVRMKTRTLSSVLEEHVGDDQPIDLLSVDVEGLEQEVLASNDWTRFRPDVVMIEHHAELTSDIFGAPIVVYLDRHGYRLIGKTPNELLFLTRARSLDKMGRVDYAPELG